MGKYLYGLHDEFDPSLRQQIPNLSWVVVAIGIGSNPSDTGGTDLTRFSNIGITPIVRLSNAFWHDGTLPHSSNYGNFAQRVQNFVRASRGVRHWMIGNEMNLANERHHGEVVTPEMYASVFKMCQAKIKELQTDAIVMNGAVAPWNIESGYWQDYFAKILELTSPDAINLHTYTHGSAPNLIYSDAKMNPPYDKDHYHFYVYRDFLARVPQRLRHLPAFITETDMDEAWTNSNNGWIKNAFGDINWWNQQPGTQKIHALVLYRWQQLDKWGIDGKAGTIEDFKQAAQMGYEVPKTGVSKVATQNSKPATGRLYALTTVNIRRAPSLTGEIVGQLSPNEEIAITAEQQADGLTWVQFEKGWAAKMAPNGQTLLGNNRSGPSSNLISELSQKYGVDEKLIRAVINVESGGSGLRNGRVLIRVEAHLLIRELGDIAKQYLTIGNPIWTGHKFKGQEYHGNQDKEWEVLNFFAQIDAEKAYRSTSFGSGQIMGFHAEKFGYGSAVAMAEAFKDQDEQIRAMFTFMKNGGMIDALKRGDIEGFVSSYNGPGQVQHYTSLIRKQL